MTNLQAGNIQKDFYGKAKVEENCQFITLYSYETAICRVSKSNGHFVRIWGGYSATTMRHINAFLDTLGLDRMNKKQWEALSVA